MLLEKFFSLVLKNSSRFQYSGENLGMKIIENQVSWAENKQLEHIILMRPFLTSFLFFLHSFLFLFPTPVFFLPLFSVLLIFLFFFSSPNVYDYIFEDFSPWFYPLSLSTLLIASLKKIPLISASSEISLRLEILSLALKKKNN